MVTIRKYNPREDEQNWVRCRVLSLLDTPYYDDVLRHKQTYENPSIELVAVSQGSIIGILDLELDTSTKVICYRTGTKGAILRNLMVLPEFRQKGVAAHLMDYALTLLREEGMGHLEIWIRENEEVKNWLCKKQFMKTYSYLHFYAEDEECRAFVNHPILDCFFKRAYGEYTGRCPDEIRQKFKRVYESALYERHFSPEETP